MVTKSEVVHMVMKKKTEDSEPSIEFCVISSPVWQVLFFV